MNNERTRSALCCCPDVSPRVAVRGSVVGYPVCAHTMPCDDQADNNNNKIITTNVKSSKADARRLSQHCHAERTERTLNWLKKTSFPNKEAGARSFYLLEPSLRNRWTAQLWYDAHPRPNRRFAAAICT